MLHRLICEGRGPTEPWWINEETTNNSESLPLWLASLQDKDLLVKVWIKTGSLWKIRGRDCQPYGKPWTNLNWSVQLRCFPLLYDRAYHFLNRFPFTTKCWSDSIKLPTMVCKLRYFNMFLLPNDTLWITMAHVYGVHSSKIIKKLNWVSPSLFFSYYSTI